MKTQLRQWSSKCNAFFNLLNEDRNHNVSFKYLSWCLTQMKRASETDNKNNNTTLNALFRLTVAFWNLFTKQIWIIYFAVI